MQDEFIIDSYLPRMERHPTILETLVPVLFHKEKSPLLRDLGSPLLFPSMQKIPNSLTIEFLEISHLLT